MNYETMLLKAIEENDPMSIENTGINSSIINEEFSRVLNIPQKQGECRLPTVSYPTPLVYAICCCQLKSAQILIKLGADIKIFVHGWAPIHYAVLSHEVKMVKMILDIDKNEINRKSSNDSTPLHFAVSSGDYQMVLYLISKGASLDQTNNMGQTPLLVSMACSDINIIKALVACGSDIDKKDNSKKKCIDIARAHGKYAYVKYIEDIINKKVSVPTRSEILSELFVEDTEVEGCPNVDNTSKFDANGALDNLEKRVSEMENK